MATLHVRNVPDELYEALRANAAFEGRSIGAQVVVLIQRALTDRRSVREQVREKLSGGLGQVRFLRDARRAVAAAQDEARELGHGEIGTAHLLLGLLHVPEVGELLAKPPLAIGGDAVRARVRALRVPELAGGRIPFGADAKQALEAALRESLALRHRHIGPEHVLLGIAAVEGAGADILRDLGADADTLRATVTLARGEGPALIARSSLEPEADWAYSAVALNGSAEDWTQILNALARDGWELVSIVSEGAEPRAVFRRSASETDL